ncbi:MmcQ/YjbR family DNA-binding protein [Enterococcus sp.]|uniref:MmcQ/YjbR family DNA-binding protein n=1 Tax=Enterococcus sp. TaxID=35783 RepID=UPI002FC8D083
MLAERWKKLQTYGANLPSAKVYFREDWEVIYFELQGKMFALLSPTVDEKTQLTIKGDPQKNEELRELYSSIKPGYHMNKRHWNSIILQTDELTDEELTQMLLSSYQLVLAKFSKKEQEKIKNNTE